MHCKLLSVNLNPHHQFAIGGKSKYLPNIFLGNLNQIFSASWNVSPISDLPKSNWSDKFQTDFNLRPQTLRFNILKFFELLHFTKVIHVISIWKASMIMFCNMGKLHCPTIENSTILLITNNHEYVGIEYSMPEIIWLLYGNFKNQYIDLFYKKKKSTLSMNLLIVLVLLQPAHLNLSYLIFMQFQFFEVLIFSLTSLLAIYSLAHWHL